MKETCKSSLSFTAGTSFNKTVVTGRGVHMVQPGLFCEMGQFIKASQSKDKTLKLELACRGKAYTPSQQCFWITGAGSRGLAPARRVKRRHKMVVRIECYLPTLPWGEKQQNIAGPHTYTSHRCYKLDR